MWVDPLHRRQGLARRMMLEAEAHSRTAGFEMVILDVLADNSGAIALYSQLGYEEFDAPMFPVPLWARGALSLRKAL